MSSSMEFGEPHMTRNTFLNLVGHNEPDCKSMATSALRTLRGSYIGPSASQTLHKQRDLQHLRAQNRRDRECALRESRESD